MAKRVARRVYPVECETAETVQSAPAPLTRKEKAALRKAAEEEAARLKLEAEEKAKADEAARQEKIRTKLERLLKAAQSDVDWQIDHAKKAWEPDSQDEKYRNIVCVWSDGTITYECKEWDEKKGEYGIKGFVSGRRDIYAPISKRHYWTGSLMATLAYEGIPLDIVLPACEVGAKGNRAYTFFQCEMKTAERIRMVMLEYELLKLQILTGHDE